jgi:hypothetical protein
LEGLEHAQVNEDELDPERKRQAAIELANAYREMMGTFAWKHLNGKILAQIREEASASVDQVPIEQLSVVHVAEWRGIRKALERIGTEIAYILDPK